MPEDIEPDALARCTRRMGGGDSGPRCRALVLVRDAREHGRWHDVLDEAIAAPVDVETSLHIAGGADFGEGDDLAVQVYDAAAPAIDRPAGL